MFSLPSINELLILAVLIMVLNGTGFWPAIIRGIRELRGEHVEPSAPGPPPDELEVCYKLLGLSPSAGWDEIERAYRRKAKVHHPDHGGDEDAMRALNEAYTRIKDSRGR